MEDSDQKRLRINHRYLVNNLVVSDFIDGLYEHGLVSLEEQEELDTERTTFKASRKLLRILPKKGPKAYTTFVQVLKESNANYDFVLEKLDETDIHNFESDDNAFDHEDKLARLQDQLNLQTELLVQYRKDKDTLEKRMKEHESETQELKAKYSDIEKIFEGQGISSGDVPSYLKEYLDTKDVPDLTLHYSASPLPSPSKTSLSSSPSFTFSIEDIESNKQTLPEAIARDIGKDLVRFMVQKTFKRRTTKPSSKYSATMRKVACELINQHEEFLTSSLVQLQMDEINGYETFIRVADEVFAEGQSNWGRVVVLYAFAGLMARFAAENGNEEMAVFMGDFLGFYVTRKLGDWIEANGGWDAFTERFSDGVTEKEGSSWRSWLLAGLGIASASAIVGLVAVHKS